MRCPKCSYISFDLLDTCVKCGKNIAGAATDLGGTVASMAPPAFLRVAGEEVAPEAPEGEAGYETEEPLDLGIEGEEEVAMDFSLEEESTDLGGEMEVDLGAPEAAAADVEPEIDLGFEEPAAEEEAIGISDLAPSEEGEEAQPEQEFAEQFEVAAEETGAPGQGLEDLKVEGIDLEAAPGVAADSDKITPSVKTGTALDDFDIDLGDLLTSKKD